LVAELNAGSGLRNNTCSLHASHQSV